MHCVIFGAMPVSQALRELYETADYIIAADAGYLTVKALGLEADKLLGDYDTAPCPSDKKAEVLPKEKDDTDTHYAVKKALKMGADKVTILGGLGGRLDHTIANMQSLVFLAKHGVQGVLADENTQIRALLHGTYEFEKQDGYVSLFAATQCVMGLTLQGFVYNLENGILTNAYPLGVSNAFALDRATVSFESGALFMMFCKE